ncbi:MAG: hypothetical protein Q4G59_05360 [Planctomycetia bacterium]|nr:hypothetical protein [Planctomycetia bacterium]
MRPGIFRLFRPVLLLMVSCSLCLFGSSLTMGEEAGFATSTTTSQTGVVTKVESQPTNLRDYFLSQVSALCDKISNTIPEEGSKRQDELKSKLLEEIPILHSQMAVGTTTENVEGWKAFLLTNEVVTTLSSAKPDYKILEKSLEAFQGKEAGLENPMFVTVRNLLKNLVNANRQNSADPKSREEDRKYISKLCSELPKSVSKLAEKYDAELAETITLALEDLKYYRPDSNDVRQLVDLISAYFPVPNFMFSISSKLLLPGVARPVSENINVADTIRGAYVTGKGHVEGGLSVSFIPNDQMAELGLLLSTQINTNTVATRDGAYVYSTSTGAVKAKKSVFINKEILTGQASASGTMSSQITGVDSGRRTIGQNIAEQRVMEEKPYSEMESTRKMEYRIATRLDEEVDTQINSLNTSLRKRFISKLEEQKYFPRAIVSRTTTERLFWSALVANDVQFGLPSPNKGIKDGEMKGDLSILLHESCPNNAAFFALAGRRVCDQEVTQNLAGFFAQEPSEETPVVTDGTSVDSTIVKESVVTSTTDKSTSTTSKDKASAASSKDRKIGKFVAGRNKRNKPDAKSDAKSDSKEDAKSKTKTEAKKSTDDTPLWLSFTGDLPIVATFDKDQIRFSMRIDQFEKDNRTYPGLDVDIIYEIAKNGSFVFRRKAIDVFPAGLKRGQVIPARFQAIRSMVLKRLEEQLEKEIKVQGIATSNLGNKSSKGSMIRKGLLVPHSVTAQGGWLQLEYEFIEDHNL